MTARADTLLVRLDGDVVATLTRRGVGLELLYTADTVRALGEGGLCLSVALPVRGKPYPAAPTLAWAEGVLPEGETRTTLEDRFSVSRGDTFGLLAAIGRDCAGAVSFVPEGVEVARDEATRTLDEAALIAAIEDLPSRPLGAAEDVQVSLGGLQAKLLLTRTDRGWARPAGGAPSTHILKPDAPRFPGLIASEALAMRTIASAGLDAAATELAEIGGQPVLIVERFDRRLVDGVVVRIHQEDGCQALGVHPRQRNKYESSGSGVSYRRLAKVLADHAEAPDAELCRLVRLMTLNVAIGNADGHARNHGFLIEAGTARLAPAYDVAPTVDFLPSPTAALRVGGEDRFEADGRPRVTALHLTLEARSWGLPAAVAEEAVRSTLAALAEAVPRAADQVRSPDGTAARILARIERVGAGDR